MFLFKFKNNKKINVSQIWPLNKAAQTGHRPVTYELYAQFSLAGSLYQKSKKKQGKTTGFRFKFELLASKVLTLKVSSLALHSKVSKNETRPAERSQPAVLLNNYCDWTWGASAESASKSTRCKKQVQRERERESETVADDSGSDNHLWLARARRFASKVL